MPAAMERIFANFKEDRGGDTTPGSYDPSDPDTYDNYIKAMISDSVDYEGSVLAGERNKAQEYYYGHAAAAGRERRDAGSDTTIVQDPDATYEEILGYDKETANRVDLCVDRRARRDHADDAGTDPAVCGEREPGFSGAALARRGRPGAARRPITSTMFSGTTIPGF